MGTVIQMYASATPADNVANIDVPKTGNLIGLDWSMSVAASGADFSNRAQLSFGSVSTLNVNDARSHIGQCALAADLTTSGAAVTFVDRYVALPEIPVSAGERLYLHFGGTAISITVNLALHFDFDLDQPLTRRR